MARALRTWLLDRLEARHLWFVVDDNGDDQPVPHTVRTLADGLRGDADFINVAVLWASDALGRPDVDLAEVVAALVDSEHVPFRAAYRYKPAGLAFAGLAPGAAELTLEPEHSSDARGRPVGGAAPWSRCGRPAVGRVR